MKCQNIVWNRIVGYVLLDQEIFVVPEMNKHSITKCKVIESARVAGEIVLPQKQPSICSAVLKHQNRDGVVDVTALLYTLQTSQKFQRTGRISINNKERPTPIKMDKEPS